MKILITGANGFLGQHLTLFLAASNHEIFAASRGKCRIPKGKFTFFSIDLTIENQVKTLLEKTKPDIIIHTAALSKPDECEEDKDLCIAVNVDATKYLINHSRKYIRQFIYTSTDFIFGENGPHAEEDIPSPLNFYGNSKLQAENYLKASHIPYAIVRPVFIYGKIWEGLRPSFLHWVQSNLSQEKKIKVVNDQLRTPTFVGDICKGIETIIQQQKTGVFHLAGKDRLSPYQMAVAVANKLNLDIDLIESVTAETFVEKVKRAKKSGLKIEKAIKQLNYNPISFEEGIVKTFE